MSFLSWFPTWLPLVYSLTMPHINRFLLDSTHVSVIEQHSGLVLHLLLRDLQKRFATALPQKPKQESFGKSVLTFI